MQEYSPEEEEIRANCFLWRTNTFVLIKNEKWDLIESNPCSPNICTVCQNNIYGDSPIRPLLTFVEYDKLHYVQEVIERIYGKLTQDIWFKIIISNVPCFSHVKYFIENKLIDVNNGSYGNTLLSIYANWSYSQDWKDKWDYLLSEEVGYNVNIQSCHGENCLLSFIRICYDEDYFDQEEAVLLEYNKKIMYLLEKGADPLLTDKQGTCALKYVIDLESFEGFTEEQKEKMIQLLESYI